MFSSIAAHKKIQFDDDKAIIVLIIIIVDERIMNGDVIKDIKI